MQTSRIAIPAGAGAGVRGATILLARASSQVNTDASPGDTVLVRNTGGGEIEVGTAADVAAGQGYRLAAGASLPPVALVDGEEIHAAVVGVAAGAADVLVGNAG